MKKLISILTCTLLFASLCVTASAASYPVDGSYQDYFVWSTDENDIYCTIYDDSGVSDVYFVLDGKVLRVYFTSNGSSQMPFKFYSKNGDEWKFESSGNVTNGTMMNSDVFVISASSYDVKNPDGTIFFQATPLWEGVREVTEATLNLETIPNLVGTLKILVPCGVGLTALLVGLKLFGKRSLIFRS